MLLLSCTGKKPGLYPYILPFQNGTSGYDSKYLFDLFDYDKNGLIEFADNLGVYYPFPHYMVSYINGRKTSNPEPTALELSTFYERLMRFDTNKNGGIDDFELQKIFSNHKELRQYIWYRL